MSDLKAKIVEISGASPQKCMKCGKCSASCPNFEQMDIKPHKFVSCVINNDVEKLAASKSTEKCLSCFACAERCPRGVEPARIVDAARQLAVRKRNGDILSADDIPALIDDDTPQQLLVSAFRKYKR